MLRRSVLTEFPPTMKEIQIVPGLAPGLLGHRQRTYSAALAGPGDTPGDISVANSASQSSRSRRIPAWTRDGANGASRL